MTRTHTMKRQDWQDILGCDINAQQGIWMVAGHHLTREQIDAWDDVRFWIEHDGRVRVTGWPLPEDTTSPLTGKSLSAEAVTREVSEALYG